MSYPSPAFAISCGIFRRRVAVGLLMTHSPRTSGQASRARGAEPPALHVHVVAHRASILSGSVGRSSVDDQDLFAPARSTFGMMARMPSISFWATTSRVVVIVYCVLAM
jgi:hypothetical protein